MGGQTKKDVFNINFYLIPHTEPWRIFAKPSLLLMRIILLVLGVWRFRVSIEMKVEDVC